MNWLDKLERKLGRFAIPNLTVYLMICYVIGFMLWNLAAMNLIPAEVIGYLTLELALILRGQVWRLITWLVVPPSSNLISLVFFVLLYYSLGTALERTWGVFRYNVYIFSGLLFTVLAVFGLYAFYYFAYGFEMPMSVLGMAGSNYVTLSIFLAFAAIYPEMEVLLYFILPIKMKWMALVYVAIAGYDFINGNIVTRVVIGTSLLNFVIFFLSSRNFKRFGPGEQARKAKFKKQSRPHMTYTNGAHHRCAVCGRTELDDPCLEFRYCSKCNGNYEYCQDHLFTHEHVK